MRTMQRIPSLLFVASVFLGLGTALPAADPATADPALEEAGASGLEQRVRELEQTVQRLREERDRNVVPAAVSAPALATTPAMVPLAQYAGPTAGLTPNQIPLGGIDYGEGNKDGKPLREAGWDDAFILRSPDDKFSLRITGQLQADYRAFAGRPRLHRRGYFPGTPGAPGYRGRTFSSITSFACCPISARASPACRTPTSTSTTGMNFRWRRASSSSRSATSSSSRTASCPPSSARSSTS